MLNVSVDTLLQKDNHSRKEMFINKYKVIINCIPIMFIVIALVLACFLPGAHAYNWFYNGNCYRNLIYFIFGKGKLVTSYQDETILYESLSSGGISYFAVVSFIFVCIGVALLIWGIISNRLLIKIKGNVCMIISAILMFFIRVEGNSLIFGEGRNGYIYDYRDFYKNGDIGSGVIWWSILCFAGGVLGIVIVIWMKRWSRKEDKGSENSR